MATAEKRQQHHWQQQRLRSAGKSRSQVRSGATTAVRSMTTTAISMEFNQQQPPAENSHTQSPPPATHIYASVHPTTHPPTKLSVSQAFIQSVSQLRCSFSCSTILQNSTCENCASNANGNRNRQRILYYQKEEKSLCQRYDCWTLSDYDTRYDMNNRVEGYTVYSQRILCPQRFKNRV